MTKKLIKGKHYLVNNKDTWSHLFAVGGEVVCTNINDDETGEFFSLDNYAYPFQTLSVWQVDEITEPKQPNVLDEEIPSEKDEDERKPF